MAIVQDAYDLTDDILMKILTGEYRRIRSVIKVIDSLIIQVEKSPIVIINKLWR